MMVITTIFYKYMLPQESAGHNIEKIKKLLILTSVILTVIGYFLTPLILSIVFPKYIEVIDTIKIMSLSIIPLSIVKIYTSKFLSMEKSRHILIGTIVFLSFLIPTMTIFEIQFGILGIASSFVLTIIIQALYYYVINRKINQRYDIEKK